MWHKVATREVLHPATGYLKLKGLSPSMTHSMFSMKTVFVLVAILPLVFPTRGTDACEIGVANEKSGDLQSFEKK
jgi:hypothetical protein